MRKDFGEVLADYNQHIAELAKLEVYKFLTNRWRLIRGHMCGKCGSHTTGQLRWSDRLFVACCGDCYKMAHPKSGSRRERAVGGQNRQASAPSAQPVDNALVVSMDEPAIDEVEKPHPLCIACDKYWLDGPDRLCWACREAKQPKQPPPQQVVEQPQLPQQDVDADWMDEFEQAAKSDKSDIT